MADCTQTLSDPSAERIDRDSVVPGLLIVHHCGQATATPIGLLDGPTVLGREHGASLLQQDDRLSRRHLEVAYGEAGWTVRDLGSRNGTFVDGLRTTASPRGTRAALGSGTSCRGCSSARSVEPRLAPVRATGPRCSSQHTPRACATARRVCPGPP